MGPRGMRRESGESFTTRNFHSLYDSSNIVKVIKFRRLRWAGNVDRMEESSSAFKMLTGKPTGKRPLGGLGIDGRTLKR